MNLTDEEKKVFEILEKEYFDPSCFENYLLNIYVTDDNEEAKHNMSVTLNFIKKMIIELSKKREYDIVGNESYDIDNLLNEIIDVPSETDEILLTNFNPLLYKNPEKLSNYFNLLTSNLSWEDLKRLAQSFNWVNDGFRTFFANYFEKLIDLSVKLYYELDKSEEQEQFAKISILDEENDDWAEDNSENLEKDEMVMEFDEFGEWASDDEWMNDINSSISDISPNTVELNKETLIECIKFINIIEPFVKYRKLGFNIINKLYELARQKKLEDFYSNEEFSAMFDLIMEHDKTKCSYYFHGTQCLEDAQSIIDEGLGMVQDNLQSTAYREFTKDEVILYERGFGGEIGRDAIVIIEIPKNSNGEELNIVTQLQDASSIHFSPSGLQGLNGKPNYVVLPENIVGYVDKKNKQIVFNSKYKNYEQFSNNRRTR